MLCLKNAKQTKGIIVPSFGNVQLVNTFCLSQRINRQQTSKNSISGSSSLVTFENIAESI